MTIATQKHLSLEEYLTYEDGTDARYELVDGVLVEMGNEAKINTLIAVFLIQVFIQSGVEAYRIGIKQKVQVASAYASARDPDLIIHSKESAVVGDDESEFCLKLHDPNPLLVVEIASPGGESTINYRRDYSQKPKEYAARGIPEYWIIDPERSRVKVGLLMDGSYQFRDFVGNSAIASPTFPQLNLRAAKLLNAGR
jgi:Uma2 family endonuclease